MGFHNLKGYCKANAVPVALRREVWLEDLLPQIGWDARTLICN
jgi:hypothetical protein